jgi:hypothetical protein
MAVNTALYIFPRKLQALFSKMHRLHVLALYTEEDRHMQLLQYSKRLVGRGEGVLSLFC